MNVILVIFLGLSIVSSQALANGACDHVDLLADEDRDNTISTRTIQHYKQIELPEEVSKIVREHSIAPTSQEFLVWPVDLNGDGASEYVISADYMLGAHNFTYHIFTGTAEGWKKIATFDGIPFAVLSTGTKHEGSLWKEFAFSLRGGPHSYGVIVMSFDGVAYQDDRTKICDGGVVR